MLLCILFVVSIIILLIGISLKIYTVLTEGWCKSQVCLVGKTVIVTGANIGIGYEAALDFAKRGAKVILACRNETRAKQAQTKIIGETGNNNVHYKLVDFASFDSVRKFAKEINEKEDRLDILVNNAGAVGFDDQRTKDGHMMLMQINYFSSFLLTNLLIKLLKKSSPSRIVNVSSMAAMRATKFDLNKIDEPDPNRMHYPNSKLCNVLFTMELARKLQGTGVTTYSVHPGLVKTNIFHNMKGSRHLLFSLAANFYGKSTTSGAQTTIYCALEKGIEKYSGEYFSDCKKKARFSTMLKDPGLPKKLWEKTEHIVNVTPNEIQF